MSQPATWIDLLALVLKGGAAEQKIVAEHTAATPGLLRLLAEAPEPAVRRRVAENPSCPVDVLVVLRDVDPDITVTLRAADHLRSRSGP